MVDFPFTSFVRDNDRDQRRFSKYEIKTKNDGK